MAKRIEFMLSTSKRGVVQMTEFFPAAPGFQLPRTILCVCLGPPKPEARRREITQCGT